MFDIQEFFNVFKPILMALSDIWDFLNLGVWDAYFYIQDSVPLLGTFWKWFGGLIGDILGIDVWLNQFTVLNFSIGSGIIIIIIVTIIGWLGDKVGL